ncbi:MAG: hypothetical protein GC179_07815 [Anaerolineaceae bacterium]|nr:hypothetical protein [Anaerolineaceae bacterium]
MSPIFQPDPENLYKLMAIHKALMLAKWADPPLAPEIAGSPFIAEALVEIQQIIDKLETERGKPERANWSGNKMTTHSARWDATINLVTRSSLSRETWLNATDEERVVYARTYMSPFEPDQEQLRLFIDEVMRHFQAE